ncbi:MAG: hypothetical protein ACK4OM_05115 [Alphaproteobacteria bacterium]
MKRVDSHHTKIYVMKLQRYLLPENFHGIKNSEKISVLVLENKEVLNKVMRNINIRCKEHRIAYKINISSSIKSSGIYYLFIRENLFRKIYDTTYILPEALNNYSKYATFILSNGLNTDFIYLIRRIVTQEVNNHVKYKNIKIKANDISFVIRYLLPENLYGIKNTENLSAIICQGTENYFEIFDNLQKLFQQYHSGEYCKNIMKGFYFKDNSENKYIILREDHLKAIYANYQNSRIFNISPELENKILNIGNSAIVIQDEVDNEYQSKTLKILLSELLADKNQNTNRQTNFSSNIRLTSKYNRENSFQSLLNSKDSPKRPPNPQVLNFHDSSLKKSKGNNYHCR